MYVIYTAFHTPLVSTLLIFVDIYLLDQHLLLLFFSRPFLLLSEQMIDSQVSLAWENRPRGKVESLPTLGTVPDIIFHTYKYIYYIYLFIIVCWPTPFRLPIGTSNDRKKREIKRCVAWWLICHWNHEKSWKSTSNWTVSSNKLKRVE